MNRLIVLSGYSGSGKTTLANKLQKEQDTFCIIIQADSYEFSWGEDVTQYLIDEALKYGVYNFTVIVDAVNKHRQDKARWEQAFNDSKFFSEFKWIELEVPVDECIRRDSQRQFPVGAEAIRKQGLDWV